MAGNHWLRLWHDMPNDPKFRTIAKVSGQPIALVIAVYVHVLVSASQAVKRGETQCNAENVSSALDCEQTQIEAIWTAMEGRLRSGNRLTGWEARQPQREDNSTDRVRKFREVKSETQCNAVKRDETLDKDKDKDKELNTKPLVRSRELAEEIYSLYPRKVGRQKALQKIEQAMRAIQKTRVCSLEESAVVLIQRVREYAASPAGNRGAFTPHCSTWMNEGRWNDETAEWHREESSKPPASDFQPAKKLNPAIYREGL